MVQAEIRAAVTAGSRALSLDDGLAASAQMYRAILRIAAAVLPELEKSQAALQRAPQATTRELA
jgi:hypothetical protein